MMTVIVRAYIYFCAGAWDWLWYVSFSVWCFRQRYHHRSRVVHRYSGISPRSLCPPIGCSSAARKGRHLSVQSAASSCTWRWCRQTSASGSDTGSTCKRGKFVPGSLSTQSFVFCDYIRTNRICHVTRNYVVTSSTTSSTRRQRKV